MSTYVDGGQVWFNELHKRWLMACGQCSWAWNRAGVHNETEAAHILRLHQAICPGVGR